MIGPVGWQKFVKLRFFFLLHEALGGLRVVGVAAGLAHTVACTDSGDVYSWGWNQDGQLGLGDDSSRGEPELLSDAQLEEQCIEQVRYYAACCILNTFL